MLKQDAHIFSGMQRDMSISKQKPEFLWDAHNIRITAKEGDNLLSITNEKGTSEVTLTFNESSYTNLVGTYLGHCVINNYLVVFTKDTSKATNGDYIYRINKENKYTVDVLYEGDLRFDVNCPIETLGIYENKKIQKVYWIDGINQPREINIVKEVIDDTTVAAIRNKYKSIPSPFDFVRSQSLDSKLCVQREEGSNGTFESGVIQYALTYYDKYGQETNISYVTPLFYIGFHNRGGSPEEKVGIAFKVTITNLDKNFDFARVYSIYRSSINATPVVKRLIDISTHSASSGNSVFYYRTNDLIYVNGKYIVANPAVQLKPYKGSLTEHKPYYYYAKQTASSKIVITLPMENKKIIFPDDVEDIWISPRNTLGPGNVNDGVLIHAEGKFFKVTKGNLTSENSNETSFIDNGMIGDNIDPTSLLYMGGEKITASAITQKDGTLFLGNITITRPTVELYTDTLGPPIHKDVSRTLILDNPSKSNLYTYTTLLTARDEKTGYLTNPAGFKYGEYYRFGVQFQYETGKWSNPIFVGDSRIEGDKPTITNNILTIPAHSVDVDLRSIPAEYKKVRGVVVFPTLQDRTIVAQGIGCPTVYNLSDRYNGIPHAQSSWFFRPVPSDDFNNDGSDAERGAVVEYLHDHLLFSHGNRGAEIQGTPEFINSNGYLDRFPKDTYMTFAFQDATTQSFSEKDCTSLFAVDRSILTFHSPDVEFDSSFSSLDFTGLHIYSVGSVVFNSCIGDISIQTSSPVINSDGTGFIHRTVSNTDGSKALVAGLFYSDYLVDDVEAKFNAYKEQSFDYLFMVYPWQKSGSINNDVIRPANAGTRSSVLSKKKISNLRFSKGTTWSNREFMSKTADIQLFDSDKVTMLRLANTHSYYGNIDTVIAPIKNFSVVFSNGDYHSLHPGKMDSNCKGVTAVRPAFDDKSETFLCFTWNRGDMGKAWHRDCNQYNGLRHPNYSAVIDQSHIGDSNGVIASSKESIRMKYKSGKHLVLDFNGDALEASTPGLPMFEIVREYDSDTIFGGTGKDALHSNLWIPAGEPIDINRSDKTTVTYVYGDTWYQRYDCLKTYPFTLEDENSIVEIASFLCETRINIDGRYDKNRGQASNLVTTPTNFNLLNPVYSQLNNFFTYRILDSDYYKLSEYQNSITWSKEKSSASIVDTWSNITMANILDLDGNKGVVTSLITVNDNIYCFQENGISQIMFNSRVQIPTSDGVPVEISNNYKVDGSRYISDTMGVKNKWNIMKSTSGLYFIDSVSHSLYNLSQGLTNVSMTHGFSHWYDTQNVDMPWLPNSYSTKLFYDNNGNDLYTVSDSTSLVFSETLGQFTSFMSYENTPAMFNIGTDFYAIKNSRDSALNTDVCKIHKLFAGDYNNFFGHYIPFDITFISNADSSLDKIFTNIDLRIDFWKGGQLLHKKCFDYIRVWNEYQDTGVKPLTFSNAKPSNLKKKFRIWRLNIPRDNDKKLDRIRNTWTKIKLGMNHGETISEGVNIVLHDLSVYYHI